MCLHNPAYEYLMTDMPLRYTPDKLDDLIEDLSVQSKETLREEQDRILDLYVERTGANRKALQSLMDKDTFIDAERAQELLALSPTYLYRQPPHRTKRNKNSKLNKNRMAKPQNSRRTAAKQPSAFARFLAKTGLARMKDQVAVTAADGSEFTVEREDGDPQIGDSAYPDGNYILDDGTEIVVEGERITDIIDPVEDNTDDDPDPLASANDPEEIRELIAELQGRLKELDPDARLPKRTRPRSKNSSRLLKNFRKRSKSRKSSSQERPSHRRKGQPRRRNVLARPDPRHAFHLHPPEPTFLLLTAPPPVSRLPCPRPATQSTSAAKL